MPKESKVITKRKKFQEIEIPLTKSKVEIISDSQEDIINKTIKLDLTRQLKGKSIELILKVKKEDNKLTALPIKIELMPYFIRRMIRKKISYIEDSFKCPSQESMIIVKPFLITRKRVSRVVRKTLRNKAKNWLEDYLAEKKDDKIFSEMLSNKPQKSLSLVLKKTYPLSLCEIRVLEIERALEPKEIPKIKKQEKKLDVLDEENGLDQLKEIEDEKIRQAEEEIKKTQEKAAEKEKVKIGSLTKEEIVLLSQISIIFSFFGSSIIL